jgi:hypothetical protein
MTCYVVSRRRVGELSTQVKVALEVVLDSIFCLHVFDSEFIVRNFIFYRQSGCNASRLLQGYKTAFSPPLCSLFYVILVEFYGQAMCCDLFVILLFSERIAQSV